jgi:AraC-like DNA-binding protein
MEGLSMTNKTAVRAIPQNEPAEESETAVPDILLVEVRRRLDSFVVNELAFQYYGPLERLVRRAEANPLEALDLIAAAAAMNLEPHYVSRYFKKKTGARFKDWRNRRRIVFALEIFSLRDAGIVEVADICGFGSLSAFQRQCVRWTGLAPQALRELFRPGGPPPPQSAP